MLDDLAPIDIVRAIGRLQLLRACGRDLHRAVVEEERVRTLVKGVEVRNDDRKLLQRAPAYLRGAVDGVGKRLIVVVGVGAEIFQEIRRTVRRYAVVADERHHVVLYLTEGEVRAVRIRGDAEISRCLEKRIQLLVVDVVAAESARLCPLLLPELQPSGKLHELLEQRHRILVLRTAEMHEKVLRVLAGLPLAVLEPLEFLRQADDVDVEVAQRNPVHIGDSRVVDVVEDVYLLRELLEERELIFRKLRRLRVQPAHVIARRMDVQRVGRSGTDDEFLPCHIDRRTRFLAVDGLHLHHARIDPLLSVGVCLYEVALPEEEVFRLLAHVHEADVPERLVELAP